MDFSARQQTFGISQLQRLLGKSSQDVERFASYSGWSGLTGQLVTLDVSGALNMMVHSIAADFGIERSLVGAWLPGLRTGGLMTLGRNVDNWRFNGTAEDQNRFFASLFGDQTKAADFVATTLGCHSGTAKRQMRFHSATDVELLSEAEFRAGYSARSPRFVIDSKSLADRLAAIQQPLFVASVKEVSSSAYY
jgi:hypothetical protein